MRNFMRYGTLDDLHESDDDSGDDSKLERHQTGDEQGNCDGSGGDSLRDLLDAAEKRLEDRYQRDAMRRKEGRPGIISNSAFSSSFVGDQGNQEQGDTRPGRETSEEAIEEQREYLLGVEGKGGLPVVEAGGVRIRLSQAELLRDLNMERRDEYENEEERHIEVDPE